MTYRQSAILRQESSSSYCRLIGRRYGHSNSLMASNQSRPSG